MVGRILAPYGDKIHVFDIGNPSSPVTVATLEVDFSPMRVLIQGDHAFVAGGYDGIFRLDITDPQNPVIVGNRDTSRALDIHPVGDILYVADQFSFKVLRSWQREYDTDGNVGQSLVFADPGASIAQVRLAPQATGEVLWELSSAGGPWLEVTTIGSWLNFDIPGGNDLRWRATIHSSETGNPPAVDQMTIEWMFYAPTLELAQDIPNDQGRQMRIHWLRSGGDWWGSDIPVTEYAIYREVRDPVQKERAGGLTGESDWDYIRSVPASTDAYYSAVVPTLADSTEAGGVFWSSFKVRALTDTPGLHYESNIIEGYSIDNLSPGIPMNFRVTYGLSEGNELVWDESVDEDFRYFRIYRGDSEDFEPGPENLINECVENTWMDIDGEAGHYYKVTALDFSGNESDPATPDFFSGTGDGAEGVAFHPSYPNPFEFEARLRFALPKGGATTLEIVDVNGRLVNTLVSGDLEAGSYDVIWSRDDSIGRRVGSGVYFARLVAPGYTLTRKVLAE